MGKRPLVRRRGRGGNQFRSTSTGKVGAKANYPRFPLSEQHTGEIIDLVHERGREAPLSKIRFEDGSVSFVPAVLGTTVGGTLQFGLKSEIKKEMSLVFKIFLMAQLYVILKSTLVMVVPLLNQQVLMQPYFLMVMMV